MKFNDKERMTKVLVILGPILPILGKNEFSRKIGSASRCCYFFLILQLSAIIQKTKWAGRQADRQTVVI